MVIGRSIGIRTCQQTPDTTSTTQRATRIRSARIGHQHVVIRVAFLDRHVAVANKVQRACLGRATKKQLRQHYDADERATSHANDRRQYPTNAARWQLNSRIAAEGSATIFCADIAGMVAGIAECELRCVE